ncbi:MAG: hypothetical protein CMM98_01010 [Rickettsiales bacterium]|nr:hypothetical protein [Rickettsiales bacterium]
MLTNIIQFLLEWITVNTHYDASVFNFKVIELSSSELQTLACGGKCPIVAFFKPEVGILISKLDFENLCNQSILLHEIIHALQYLNESNLVDAFKEKEAYEIQNKFLMEISIKLELIEPLNLKKCRSLQLNTLM